MGDENTRELQSGPGPKIEHQVLISLADNSTEFLGISDLSLRPIYVNPVELVEVIASLAKGL